jgi:hypothetical protein
MLHLRLVKRIPSLDLGNFHLTGPRGPSYQGRAGAEVHGQLCRHGSADLLRDLGLPDFYDPAPRAFANFHNQSAPVLYTPCLSNPAAEVFMLFAMLMYWHDLGWYDIGAMLRYLANSDGARPWMVMHLWSLCVEEQFYFAGPGVLRKWYRHRVALLWESSRLLLSIALVVIISKFKVEAMEHFPRSLTISQSAACWRYLVRVSRKSGSGPRFPWCWRFFSCRLMPEYVDPQVIYAVCAVADLALLDCRTWCCTSSSRRIVS